MPNPRRFTNAYGNHQRAIAGESRSRRRRNGVWQEWSEWSDSSDSSFPEVSVRLRPVSSDYFRPTSWGMACDRIRCHPFNYDSIGSSGHFQYEGTGANYMYLMSRPRHPSEVRLKRSATAVTVGLPSGVEEAAINAALSKISNQSINLSVSVGEMRSTIETILDLSKRLFRSIRHAKKGRWRRAMEALNGGKLGSNHAANNYLTYMYGVVPIMNDIYGLQEHLKKDLGRKGDSFKAVGFKSKTYKADQLCSYPTANSNRIGGSGRCFARVMLYYKISDPELKELESLGVLNPAATAWELLPLSFVTDWFIPIGDFLSGLTATIGTTFSRGFIDKVFEASWTNSYVRNGWPGYQGGTPQNVEWQSKWFERSVLRAFPSPRLHFGEGLTSNVRRFTSALALARQRGW